MKKRIIVLFLCCITLFTFTGCRSKVSEDAVDTLKKAIYNLSDMKSADYAVHVHSVIDNKKQIVKIYGSYDLSKSQPRVSLQMELEQGVQKVGNYLAFYLDRDTMYVNFVDAYKAKAPYTAFAQQNASTHAIQKDIFKVSKSKLKSILKKANLQDDTLTLEFDCNKLQKAVKEETKAEYTKTLDNVSLQKLTIEAKLNKDRMTSADIHYGMERMENENNKVYEGTIKVTLQNINQVKEIVFPDFSDYQSFDALVSYIGT